MVSTRLHHALSGTSRLSQERLVAAVDDLDDTLAKLQDAILGLAAGVAAEVGDHRLPCAVAVGGVEEHVAGGVKQALQAGLVGTQRLDQRIVAGGVRQHQGQVLARADHHAADAHAAAQPPLQPRAQPAMVVATSLFEGQMSLR